MRKLSQINERLFGSGVARASSDERRLENRIGGNIKELIPIDTGEDFLWADEDLIIDGQEYFTHEEILEIGDKIASYGWRFPNSMDIFGISIEYMGEMRKREQVTFSSYDAKVSAHDIICTSPHNGEEVSFITTTATTSIAYFLDTGTSKRYNGWFVTVQRQSVNFGMGAIKEEAKCRIRLIKDK